MRPCLAIFTSIALLLGCERSSSTASRAPATQPWLDPSSEGKMTAEQVRDHFLKADAESDVEAALAHGDRRFICVMGYAETYPGVQDASLVKRYGSWTFPYVTDVVTDHQLHDRAQTYAEQYNKLLEQRLKTNPG